MHKTRNDLDKKVRKAVTELLAARLADTQDLYFQIKQAHWTVRGPNFIAYHQLFDGAASEVDEQIDEIAERIAQLGGLVEGTLQAAAKATTLKPYKTSLVEGPDHLSAVADALAEYGAKARAAIDTADKAGDKDTADLFTEISRAIDKQLWFVEAHLQAAK